MKDWIYVLWAITSGVCLSFSFYAVSSWVSLSCLIIGTFLVYTLGVIVGWETMK